MVSGLINLDLAKHFFDVLAIATSRFDFDHQWRIHQADTESRFRFLHGQLRTDLKHTGLFGAELPFNRGFVVEPVADVRDIIVTTYAGVLAAFVVVDVGLVRSENKPAAFVESWQLRRDIHFADHVENDDAGVRVRCFGWQ